MRGLLIKDLALLTQRKQTILIFLAVCVFMGFTMDDSFIIGYISFFSAIISMSTIAYDDADNGMLFLMTLPISRKTYAYSKYVLGGIFCCISFVFAVVLILMCHLFKGISLSVFTDFASVLLCLPFCALVLDLMIPLQLKFGSEKSRMVLLVIFGGLAAIGVVLKKAVGTLSFLNQLADSIVQIPSSAMIAGLILFTLAATCVSIICSKRVMTNKTF